jgi:hypothetical protein
MTAWTVAAPYWTPDNEQYWWALTNPDGTTRLAYDLLSQARASGLLPEPVPPPAPVEPAAP